MNNQDEFKDNDEYNYSCITKGKGNRKTYQVCDAGFVLSTSASTYKQKRLKPYLKRGRATVNIAGSDTSLKNLVAKHFLKGYKPGIIVECINGNPMDCSVKNLRLCTYHEHGKRTGHLCGSHQVIVNGVKYRSIRTAAKALHVSYQALRDYINGKIKRRSVIDDLLKSKIVVIK